MKKLTTTLLTAGIALTVSATTAFAAETESEPVKKINIPVKHAEVETPEFLVNGALKDVTQKILPISVEARYFAPHFDMGAKSNDIGFGNVSDSIWHDLGKVSLKDNLGFGNDNSPEVIFRYKRFTADYFYVHGSGSNDLTDTSNWVKFAGVEYPGQIDTKSDLHYLKLQMNVPIVEALGQGVDCSFGLTGMQWEGTVTGLGTHNGIISNYAGTEKLRIALPTVGVGAHASLLDTLLFNVHLSGMSFGKYGNFYDLEAGIRYNPIDLLSVSLGYRRIHATVKDDDTRGNFDLNGPYAGLRFDF